MLRSGYMLNSSRAQLLVGNQCLNTLWDPLYEVHSNRLEGVQRLATKIVTKKWDTHYNHLLNVLKWERLSLRRKKQRVMLCHRILRGAQ